MQSGTRIQKRRQIGLAVAAAFAAAALFAAQGAQADTLSLNGWAVTTGSTPAFNLHNPNEGVYAGGFAGVYTSGASSTSFVAYCVDLSQTFNWGSAFAVTPASASSVFTATQYAALDHLYTQHFPATTDKATSAAFQLAVWEIITETSGSYSLTAGPGQGSFWATPYGLAATEGSALTTANLWLGTVGTGAAGGYSLTVLQSQSNQDQLIATPIPEPETYAMLLAGLGLLGFAARRRKLKEAAAA